MLTSTIFGLVGLLAHVASAKTVTYNWDITWVWASPDGHGRPVIGINGKWPCPPIEVNTGDRVVIHTTNRLQNETTSIHFHGLFQKGSNAMDGPAAVTQCPIPPGGTITYDFQVPDQVGTYWYHSHNMGQYLDGLRGPLIIHDPYAPFARQIDGEFTVTLSDWYHDQAPGLLHYFLSKANEDDGGSEPIPDTTLMQDTQNAKYPVQTGKTYYVHVINMGGFVGQYFSIDGHDMTIVEVDGNYVQPYKTSQIYLTVAQRIGVLITTKNNKNNNYGVMAQMDQDMFDHVPPGVVIDSAGFLVYDDKKPMPKITPIKTLNAPDDMKFVPWNRQGPLKVDHTIKMDFVLQNQSNRNTAFINGNSYIPQKVPTLYTALSVGKDATDPRVYGVNSNPYVLEYGKVYEIVLNNQDTGGHPWHLHGHVFQIVARSPEDAGLFPGWNNAMRAAIPQYPLYRDTVQVKANGYLVIRFVADNPGINLFHCHIEWHVEAGLTATLIEAPMLLQQQSIPADHLKICRDQNVPTQGNAAGNTKNHFNLNGANTAPDPDPWGALINKPS